MGKSLRYMVGFGIYFDGYLLAVAMRMHATVWVVLSVATLVPMALILGRHWRYDVYWYRASDFKNYDNHK